MDARDIFGPIGREISRQAFSLARGFFKFEHATDELLHVLDAMGGRDRETKPSFSARYSGVTNGGNENAACPEGCGQAHCFAFFASQNWQDGAAHDWKFEGGAGEPILHLIN